MHAAAQILVGKHDFTSFRASECQANSPEKTLDVLQVSRRGEAIEINARARSFLHHQIRNIAGTLRLVGAGKWTRADLARALAAHALAAHDRSAAGETAPAEGLYFLSAEYEGE
jgi:tRNA pseudouridine38-40 synthase